MTPTVGPDIAHNPLRIKRPSISSIRSLSDVLSSTSSVSSVSSFSSSATSIGFGSEDVEVVTEAGLRHAPLKLEARKYKSLAFAQRLFDIISILRVSSWASPSITPGTLQVHKVSGSLTNAVFFVSCPLFPTARTLLLRIYGPSSGELISRPRELHTLHVLSSQYLIGPKVYGTFENGRVEEYFDSVTLTMADLRDKTISQWIGARMAELHCVDIEAIEQTSPLTKGEGKGWQIGAKKNVRSWIIPAREVLRLPTVSDAIRKELDLDAFQEQWEGYMRWLDAFERKNGSSKRVFAHNDAQYGNLLRLTRLKEGQPEHRQIIVVDFEYASPNPAAYDIANHFHEWTANYHSSTPHILDPTLYPTLEERRNFYRAYLAHSCPALSTTSAPPADMEAEMERLESQVLAWSPASHAMWAVWGLVQAREQMEGKPDAEPADFDYLGYARYRMAAFRMEISSLGL